MRTKTSRIYCSLHFVLNTTLTSDKNISKVFQPSKQNKIVTFFLCWTEHFNGFMHVNKRGVICYTFALLHFSDLNILFQPLPRCPSTTRPSSERWPTWATSWSRWTTWRRPSRCTRSSSHSPSRSRTRCLKLEHLAGWDCVTDCWRDLTSHWAFILRWGLPFYITIQLGSTEIRHLPHLVHKQFIKNSFDSGAIKYPIVILVLCSKLIISGMNHFIWKDNINLLRFYL